MVSLILKASLNLSKLVQQLFLKADLSLYALEFTKL